VKTSHWLCAAVLLALTGCFSLDPFLYNPKRTDKYVLEMDGGTPEETVTADRVEQVTIKVDDQVSLGAAYVKGNVQPPRAYVIFFHGQSNHLGTIFDRTKRWSNLGYDVLTFDYRGYGTSTNVTPTEDGILQDTQAVRAWMLQRIGSANASRLVYYGHSLGSATATQLAEAAAPAALVLESAFASVHDFETDSSGMDFSPGFVAKCRWPTVDRIRNVHVPVLLVHGLADDYVRAEFSKAIFANANEPKELTLVEGAQHSDIPEVMGGAAYGDLMNRFLGQALP
jgi:alpha-beta hydrolase superfamily lysophospholipase